MEIWTITILPTVDWYLYNLILEKQVFKSEQMNKLRAKQAQTKVERYSFKMTKNDFLIIFFIIFLKF